MPTGPALLKALPEQEEESERERGKARERGGAELSLWSSCQPSFKFWMTLARH